MLQISRPFMIGGSLACFYLPKNRIFRAKMGDKNRSGSQTGKKLFPLSLPSSLTKTNNMAQTVAQILTRLILKKLFFASSNLEIFSTSLVFFLFVPYG